MSEGTFNPAERRLCPDGSCIGLLGGDGHCRVCGRAGDGSAAVAVFSSVPSRDAAEEDDDGGAADDSLSASAGGADSDGEARGGFQPDRRLCDDGSCVGVIGAGDVCSVCGRPAGS